MPDGKLTSLDNRRLMATNKARTKVNIVEYGFNEAMPDSFKFDIITGENRFKFKSGVNKGKYANTYGDAMLSRISGQDTKWIKANPNGSFETPIIK